MRIIPQEELDVAEITPMETHWKAPRCCVRGLFRATGCTQECRHAEGHDWSWHGQTGEAPSPETVVAFNGFGTKLLHVCFVCGNQWGVGHGYASYRDAVHARAATIHQALGDFDEEAERARLMPV